ncbi:MAG: tetratricopeptide repeat protein, partial [Bacteroidota bacterium]
IARKTGQRKEEGLLLRNKSIIYNIKGAFRSANQYAEQAIVIFQDLKAARDIAITWNAIGINYMKMGEYDQALHHFDQAIPIFEAVADSTYLIKIVSNKGAVYLNKADYVAALAAYQTMIEYAKAKNDMEQLGVGQANQGRVYRELGNYTKALALFFEAKRSFEALESEYHLANVTNDIGLIYKQVEMYPEAIQTLKVGLEKQTALGNKLRMGWCHTNLGGCFLSLGAYKKASTHMERALALYKASGSKANVSALINTAICYQNYEKYDTALYYIDLAVTTAKELKRKNRLALALQTKGSIYLEQEDWKTAEQYLLESYALWLDLNSPDRLSKTAIDLKAVYEQLEQTQEVDYYERAVAAIKDTLFSRERNKELTRLMIREELKIQADTLAQLLVKQKALEMQQSSKQTLLWSGLVFALLLTSLFVLWRKKQQVTSAQEQLLKERTLEQQKRLASEATNRQLMQQLQQKNLEMSYLALNQLQQNEFIGKQKLGIKELSNSYPDNKKVRQLLHAYHFHDLANDNWEQFKNIFEEIFPDFLQRLTQQIAGLTTKELRHCVLIRLNV